MYDFVIVGAGFSGATFARIMSDRGKKCVVIDKRDHIAGNCYTKYIEGTHIHVYGPHIFHTSDDDVWNFVNQYTKFNAFINRPKAIANNVVYSLPINMMTLQQLWGVTNPIDARRTLEQVTQRFKAMYPTPQNAEEWALTQVGDEIYETLIKGYSTKQWMRTPDKLPASILKRIPIRLTWDDNYYNDKYQGIPVNGYTPIFERLLEGIEVKLSTDFVLEKGLLERLGRKIVYTGSLDELHGYVHGDLDYRTLKFENVTFNEDHQGNAVMNYPSLNVPWTRKIEHKHFNVTHNTVWSTSIVTTETPDQWSRGKIPYYPINDETNERLHKKYRNMTSDKYIVAGRLGRYRYLDMHQAIASAMKIANEH
jgi:UDP-galactopyranose mutase